MIRRIDHVGLVTGDPKAAAAGLDLLSMRPAEADTVDSYGVTCQYWQCPGDHPAIELVVPVRQDNDVSGHLDRRGPGLHHVAFEVDDIDAELAALRGKPVVFVDEEPRPGGRAGLRVAFVHMGPATGLLVEFIEYPTT